MIVASASVMGRLWGDWRERAVMIARRLSFTAPPHPIPPKIGALRAKDPHVQPHHRLDPARRARRRPRPARRPPMVRPARAGAAADARRTPVPRAAPPARLFAAAVRRHAPGAGRTAGPLDAGLPRLHPLPGCVPDHAGRAGGGAEA